MAILRFYKQAMLFCFFADFMMIYAFYNSIFISNGVSGSSLLFLFVIMQAAKLLFDLPIGVIGDLYNRKYVLFVGLICRMLFCILLLFNSYFTFVLAAVFYGLSNSCFYFHIDTYYYDILSHFKIEHIYSKFIGKYYALQNLSITIAMFCSSFVYRYLSYSGVISISIFSLFLATIVLMRLPSYPTIANSHNYCRDKLKFFKKAATYFFYQSYLIKVVLISGLLDALFIIFLDLNVIIMNYAGYLTHVIPIIIGFISFMRIFTNYFSWYGLRYLSIVAVKDILLFFAIVLMLSSCFDLRLCIIMIGLYLCFYPFLDNSVKTKLQTHVNPLYRTTVISFSCFVSSVMSISMNIFNGYILSNYNIRSLLLCSGMAILIILSLIRNFKISLK